MVRIIKINKQKRLETIEELTFKIRFLEDRIETHRAAQDTEAGHGTFWEQATIPGSNEWAATIESKSEAEVNRDWHLQLSDTHRHEADRLTRVVDKLDRKVKKLERKTEHAA